MGSKGVVGRSGGAKILRPAPHRTARRARAGKLGPAPPPDMRGPTRGTGQCTTRDALHSAPQQGPARICGADHIFHDRRLLPRSINRL